MKKLTIFLLALGFCSVGLAHDHIRPTINYFNGFYLGIGAGVVSTHTDATAEAIDISTVSGQSSASSIMETESLSADLGKMNGAGNIFVGWGTIFSANSKGYFGAELFGRYVPSSMSAQVAEATQTLRGGPSPHAFVQQQNPFAGGGSALSSSTDVELTNDYSFGGYLKLGYLITPKVMIYALAGLDVGEFDYKIHHFANFELPQNVDYSGEVETWQYGFMPGVGMEAILTDHISVRAQYTYTLFGDGDTVNVAYSMPATMPGAPSINGTLTGVANSVQRGLFTIDLTYRFKGV